jgi:hypothetical protein
MDLDNRYKDDVYDRIWTPAFLYSDWTRLRTSLNNDDLGRNDYEIPAIVMSTAITPINASAPLQTVWVADSVNDQYYLYLHINEVKKLAENETRAINITVNDEFWYKTAEIPEYRSVDTIFSTKPLTEEPQVISCPFLKQRIQRFHQSSMPLRFLN